MDLPTQRKLRDPEQHEVGVPWRLKRFPSQTFPLTHKHCWPLEKCDQSQRKAVLDPCYVASARRSMTRTTMTTWASIKQMFLVWVMKRLRLTQPSTLVSTGQPIKLQAKTCTTILCTGAVMRPTLSPHIRRPHSCLSTQRLKTRKLFTRKMHPTCESLLPCFPLFLSLKNVSVYREVDIDNFEGEAVASSNPLSSESRFMDSPLQTSASVTPSTLRPMSSRLSARPPTAAERRSFHDGANKDSGTLINSLAQGHEPWSKLLLIDWSLLVTGVNS